ncbi:unannotated protein [freshwater metagenome]|uniref:Unannotated protein n=1 Tax=freshwater metagenome TaxID=449393 RepID=A0A6J6JDZ4_9ZZZZ
MIDCVLKGVNNLHRKVEREIFVSPVLRRRWFGVWKNRSCRIIGVDFHVRIDQSIQDRRNQPRRSITMNEQRFERVAHADALGFGIVNDVTRHLEFRAGIEENVDDACSGFDDGNARVVDNRADE